MLSYIICLFIFFLVVSFVIYFRYNVDGFDLFGLNFYSLVASLIITFILVVFASNYYDATIEDQFPKEFETYSANEDKLWEFDSLNDEGMLSEAGKDKVLVLTESNVDLKAELERKLEETDANIKYEEKESIIVKSVFTVVYSLFFGVVGFFAEWNLRDEKKKKLINLLTN